ncbi:porin [Cupriavidus basilensis]
MVQVTRYAMNGGGLSSSRWGLRGNEDLGGGLSGIFVLESGFSADDGKSLARRVACSAVQAFVGLQRRKLWQGHLRPPVHFDAGCIGPFSPAARWQSCMSQ